MLLNDRLLPASEMLPISELLPIREISLVKDRLVIEQNDNMSDADKQSKIAEIEKQLAELATYQELLKQFN